MFVVVVVFKSAIAFEREIVSIFSSFFKLCMMLVGAFITRKTTHSLLFLGDSVVLQ
jgi:hypothetical protein